MNQTSFLSLLYYSSYTKSFWIQIIRTEYSSIYPLNINGLSEFIVDATDYNTDKLYFISEKQLESKIKQEYFKFEANIIFDNIVSNLTIKM